MRFLDTDTSADVIALLNRMWGAASDDFKVQQWVAFDGLCAKKNPEAEASLVCVKRASASGGTSANCATTLSVHLISQAFLF